jgi:hypothetical protein
MKLSPLMIVVFLLLSRSPRRTALSATPHSVRNHKKPAPPAGFLYLWFSKDSPPGSLPSRRPSFPPTCSIQGHYSNSK